MIALGTHESRKQGLKRHKLAKFYELQLNEAIAFASGNLKLAELIRKAMADELKLEIK